MNRSTCSIYTTCFIVLLCLGTCAYLPSIGNACEGPNCPTPQYVPTIKLAPWNWGSRIVRLRRVPPAVTLNFAQPQQMPQPIPQPQQPQGRWQWIPGQ